MSRRGRPPAASVQGLHIDVPEIDGTAVVVVLEPDVSPGGEVLHLPPGLCLPVQHPLAVQLHLQPVPHEGDLEVVPLPGRSGGQLDGGLGVVRRTGVVNALAGIVDLDLEGVVDVVVAGGNPWNPDEYA